MSGDVTGVEAMRRMTPFDPYPAPRPLEEVAREQSVPQELGPDAIAILEGRTFMFSNSVGDVPPRSIGGFVQDDTRLLSRWELSLNGRPLSLLKSGTVDYYSAATLIVCLPRGSLLAAATQPATAAAPGAGTDLRGETPQRLASAADRRRDWACARDGLADAEAGRDLTAAEACARAGAPLRVFARARITRDARRQVDMLAGRVV
jgi:N-terminal domain of (some) glycogen debranching enzymes